MLIGREEETRQLKKAYESAESEFVAVYGRLRVGKTYLVREVFKDKFTFYHTGLSGVSKSEQLAFWRQALERYGHKCSKALRNWAEAFFELEELIQQSKAKKKVIFIDEMPWLDTPGSKFVTWLEAFWNGWAAARNDVFLIACGSAASWIIRKVFRNRGGLHNRVTYRIPVEPFTLGECEAMTKRLGMKATRYDILEGYMVMGGIPFYWSLLDKEKSMAGNIDSLFFKESGQLHYEFNELYSSLFRQPENYIKVVTVLALNQRGMTREEIIKEAGIHNNGDTSQLLDDLQQCGFISMKYPFGGGKTKVIYHLIDNFTLFHFCFLNTENATDENYWTTNIQSLVRNAWADLSFEHVCFQHIKQIKNALGIGGVATKVYSWKCGRNDVYRRGAQIDLLIERADRVINVCEVKFSQEKYSISKYRELSFRNKLEQFRMVIKKRMALHLTFISTYGLKYNQYSGFVAREVTADDLFKSE